MGLTVLDAGVLIGLLETQDSHHSNAVAALRRSVDAGDRMVLPASAYAEVLVVPTRLGSHAITSIDAGLERLAVEIQPLDRNIARAAALVRARHTAMKLPDALVVATAMHLDADTLLTTDRRWPDRATMDLRADIVTL